MGSNLACPCSSRESISKVDSLDPLNKKYDIIDEIMKEKLDPKNILLDFSFENVKINLIKSNQLESFCNNRNLFKLHKKNEFQYCNKIFTTNFLTRRDLNLIILQLTEKPNNDKNLISGIYKIDKIPIDYKINYNPDFVKEFILQKIK